MLRINIDRGHSLFKMNRAAHLDIHRSAILHKAAALIFKCSVICQSMSNPGQTEMLPIHACFAVVVSQHYCIFDGAANRTWVAGIVLALISYVLLEKDVDLLYLHEISS